MGRHETNTKKRKRRSEAKTFNETTEATEVDTGKPTAIFQPTKGREWTVSVALPGSIIANAQSQEQKTTLAGHIARALSVFCVDEIVIFSDRQSPETSRNGTLKDSNVPDNKDNPSRNEYTGSSDPDHFLIHILSYLETPPHLRKHLFPLHPNLRIAGTLHSLDLPHHLKSHEWCQYREGVTLPGSDENGTFVEAGLRIPVTVGDQIPPNTRVTLKFLPDAKEANENSSSDLILANPVSPDEPRKKDGYYWGYHVRRAEKLSDVYTECLFDNGYDVTIGTSERGSDIETLFSEGEQKIENFSHLLIVIGGVSGLEVAVKNDDELRKRGIVNAKDVFDRWINVCPHQGSRTIRTEEALWITLARLKRLIDSNF